LDAVPVDSALQNIEVYSSVSVGVNAIYEGQVQDSVTIEFLRIG